MKLRLILIFALIGWIPERGFAQADVIVRGTAVDVARIPAKDYIVTRAVTLEVNETIKGKETKRISFVAYQHKQGRTIEQWRDAKSDVLWFLSRRPATRPKDEPAEPTAAEQIASHGTDLFLGGLGWQKIALGQRVKDDWTAPPPIFTTELRLLDKPDEILKTTREMVAAVRKRGPVRVHTIDVPRAIPARLGHSGDANRFDVAVDPHLEALARRLIAAPREVLSQAGEYSWKPKTDAERKQAEAGRQFDADRLRAEGVKALAYFKSADNIAIVKPLLADKANLVERPAVGPGKPERVYCVREAAAYNVLREWGVDVTPKPLLREGSP